MPVLTTELGGLTLKSPIVVASGTFGYGDEAAAIANPEGMGAIVIKSLTLDPRCGNPPPRIAETAAGMLNSIGLQNIGLDRFLGEKLGVLARMNVPIIVNVAGGDMDEYVQICRRLKGKREISAVEINISCPNVKAGGIEFGRDPETARIITAKTKEAWCGMTIIKLSPNVTDIAGMARAVEQGGADAITACNTFLGMAVDARRRRPILSNVFGGLSGPAIKPLALRCVWEVAGAVRVPVIGNGGIFTGIDAAEFLFAGARAVAVGTANLVDPGAAERIRDELEELMAEEGIERVSDMVGAARK